MPYTCARCGKQHRTTDTMLYSSWTKLRYCAYGLAACTRRAETAKRQAARAAKAAHAHTTDERLAA